MDDDVLIRPFEPSDVAPDRERVTEAPPGGSGWWPAVAVIASVIALFALIRDDGGTRVDESAEATAAPVSAPVTSPVTQVRDLPAAVPALPTFDPPLLGRVWNSELVLVDVDVVRFIDLATGEVRSADVTEEIRPPVAFYEDSIAFSNGRDLIRITPGFANPRVVRAGARDVVPLPGVPVAFHHRDSGTAEIVVVGDEMGSITWLEAGTAPLAMWNGRVLVFSADRGIELVSLDGSESELLAEGTVLSASGDAVLFLSCADPLSPDEGRNAAQGGATSPAAEPVDDLGCRVMLMRRDLTITPAVELPDEVLTVSIGPNGNHLIFTAPDEQDPGVVVVFVASTEEGSIARSVASLELDAMIDWPDPMWSQDGSVAVIAGRDGAQMIDVESGGAIDIREVVGDVGGDIVGFVSIRHEAGITSPADGSTAPAG